MIFVRRNHILPSLPRDSAMIECDFLSARRTFVYSLHLLSEARAARRGCKGDNAAKSLRPCVKFAAWIYKCSNPFTRQVKTTPGSNLWSPPLLRAVFTYAPMRGKYTTDVRHLLLVLLPAANVKFHSIMHCPSLQPRSYSLKSPGYRPIPSEMHE